MSFGAVCGFAIASIPASVTGPVFTFLQITERTSSTIGTSYTLDVDSTVYGVAVVRNSGAPSIAQIKAGQNSGGTAAKAAFSEAVIASITEQTIFSSLDRPIYDCYYVASDGANDSAVQSLLGEFKLAPDGLQYTLGEFKQISAITQANPPQVTVPEGHGVITGNFGRIFGVEGMTQINSLPSQEDETGWYHLTRLDDNNLTLQSVDATNPDDWVAGANIDASAYGAYTANGVVTHGRSVCEGASPMVADGDILICETEDNHAHVVSMQADGVPVIEASGGTGAHIFGANVYDVSADAYLFGSAETDLQNFQFGSSAAGSLLTSFLNDLTAVPAGAVFRAGAAYAQDGARYVALWPSSNAVFYLGPFAHRADGALLIDPNGTKVVSPVGVALTYRGEVIVEVSAPAYIHNGWPLLDSGSVCMSEIS